MSAMIIGLIVTTLVGACVGLARWCWNLGMEIGALTGKLQAHAMMIRELRAALNTTETKGP